jgi:hypothetical protein
VLYDAPIDIQAQKRMTILCLNRILGAPGVPELIASYLNVSPDVHVLRRAGRIQSTCWSKNNPTFDVPLCNLTEAVMHVKELACYLKCLLDNAYALHGLICTLESLCRFKALRPVIADEALLIVISAVKRHQGQGNTVRRRLICLVGRLLQVDAGVEVTVQDMLLAYKNQIVDQVLDAGLQTMLLSAPHMLRFGAVRRLIHINLMNRPLSRHYKQAPAFFAVLSTVSMFGEHAQSYSLTDLQNKMDDWELG